MKSMGEKLYDACRLWNLADFVPWRDAPEDLRTQVEMIAVSFVASLSTQKIDADDGASTRHEGKLRGEH